MIPTLSPRLYAEAALFLLAAVFVGLFVWRGHRIESLKQDLAVLSLKQEQWQSAASECSKAVDTMKRDADAQKAKAQKAIDQAKQQTLTLERRAQSLIGAAKPQNLSACEAAEQVMNDEITRGLAVH